MNISPEMAQAELARRQSAASGPTPEQAAAELAKRSTAAPVLQEMHPTFTTGDRLAVKNLANSNESAANYLRKQHPELEIQHDINGQITARAPGESQFRVLDPDTGFFSTDFLRDVGDVATDVGTGVAESLATVGAGILAAPSGPGALVAASAAGGGTGAGLEYLRQLAGEKMGVNDSVDYGDVALSGAFGAASPALFGTGASIKQIGKAATKELAKQGVEGSADDIAKQFLKSQSGLIGRGFNKFAPKIGAIASGVPEDVVRHMKESPDLIDKIDGQGLMQYIEGVSNDITETGLAKKAQLGQKVSQTFDQARTLTKELEQAAPDTPNALLGLKGFGPDDTAAQILDAVQVDVTKVSRPFDELLGKLRETAARHPTQDNLDKVEYLEQQIKGMFGDQPRLDGDSAWTLKQDIDNLGQMFKVGAGTKSSLPKGAAKVEKEMIQAARAASKEARAELLRVADLLSPGGGKTIDDAFKTYSNLSRQMDFLDQFTADPEKSYRSLNNLLNDARRVKKQRVQGLDADLAEKTLNAAKDLSAYKSFTGGWLPISSQGSTSTSRTIPAGLLGAGIGYYAGANSGLGQGSAGPFGLLGGAIGAMAGGPQALKAYMKLGRGIKGLNQGVANMAPVPIQPQIIPWLNMRYREQSE